MFYLMRIFQGSGMLKGFRVELKFKFCVQSFSLNKIIICADVLVYYFQYLLLSASNFLLCTIIIDPCKCLLPNDMLLVIQRDFTFSSRNI